ncbi:uncharacterized protein LOC106717315 [Papilio machaon]|uniref:uncharacterized protein LOC106717315 n=1 Tax=Papilio machaon TaxID=76193 RepID=UPI001E6638DE|nr:uncharacterized protein LOC106717315 [Papilio machaon]
MESPPSFSTHSEAPLLSEDSGLLITSGSFSSDSASGWHHITSELQESDFEEGSLSLCESTDTPERMCDDFFNTVKKNPGKPVVTPIEPPPEFQDDPVPSTNIDKFIPVSVPPRIASIDESPIKVTPLPLDVGVHTRHVSPLYPRKLKPEALYERRQGYNHRFASPRLLHLSPCRGTRPSSRNSLTSRLSSSHNSLITQFQADDSNFITQAISHDTLSAKTSDITDMYNVPFDSDIYAVPIDMVRPSHSTTRGKPKKPSRPNKRRGKSTPQNIGSNFTPLERSHKPKDFSRQKDSKTKRHSLPSSSVKKNTTDSDTDSLHLTLREMRKYLHTLYSSSSDSECRNTIHKKSNTIITNVGIHMRHTNNKESATTVFIKDNKDISRTVETNNNHRNTNKNSVGTTTKVKKHKENVPKEIPEAEKPEKVTKKASNAKTKMSPVRMLSMNLKQSFCNLFRWRRSGSEEASSASLPAPAAGRAVTSSPPAAVRRALPPLPQSPQSPHTTHLDFATSIQKVKDYPWYWGPISVEAAEKILSNEPDGSFIVRDSSDDHYIFTLTFKLNGLRHVRIEHDQGNFCFGGCTMFKAQTIVEFIENAVETSRSGRYLFFLNLRPVLGPVRVQLLYPVSRFKRVQSLQHTCRFVILKYVRRDLISSLPLPRRLLDYLSATHYYSELLAEI